MQCIICKYKIIIFFIIVTSACSSISAQDTISKDSIRRHLLKYLETTGALDEAMNLVKEIEKKDGNDYVHLYSLLKKKQELKLNQDSINLNFAELLKGKEMTSEALTIFRQLRSSSSETIRNRAVAVSDSLVIAQKPKWYSNYPWNEFPLKSFLPWVGLALAAWFIAFGINIRKNKKKIDIKCRDKDEAASMISAIQLVRNEIEIAYLEEQKNELINTGPKGVLPHLANDTAEDFNTLISVVVPSQMTKLFGRVWKAGQKPIYRLNILIDSYDNDIMLTIRLYRKGGMLKQWATNTNKTSIQEFRLDFAYELFMYLKSLK